MIGEALYDLDSSWSSCLSVAPLSSTLDLLMWKNFQQVCCCFWAFVYEISSCPFSFSERYCYLSFKLYFIISYNKSNSDSYRLLNTSMCVPLYIKFFVCKADLWQFENWKTEESKVSYLIQISCLLALIFPARLDLRWFSTLALLVISMYLSCGISHSCLLFPIYRLSCFLS